MKKNKNDDIHPLVFMFGGEFVEIVQDFEITTQIKIDEDHSQEIRMPMTVQGFLADCDGTFVYLSNDGEEISQALPVSSIKHIALIDLTDQEQDLLDEVPSPSDRSGYN
jgi:hypothetical protein